MVITNYMIQKKLAYINQQSRQLNSTVQSRVNPITEEGTVELREETITQVKGDVMITREGSRGRLFSPMPCLHWKCTATPDGNGVMTLKSPVKGLFLDDGVDTYCLGVDGASDEFEVRLHVGDGEVRLNNSFLNIKSSHIVRNGLEE